jgi:hypothetical protein
MDDAPPEYRCTKVPSSFRSVGAIEGAMVDAMDIVRPFTSTVVVDVMLTVLPDWLPEAGG